MPRLKAQMQHPLALAPGNYPAEKWSWGHKPGLVNYTQDFPLLQNGLLSFEMREDAKFAKRKTRYFKQFLFFGAHWI